MKQFAFFVCVGVFASAVSAFAIERSYPVKWAPLTVTEGHQRGAKPSASLVLCSGQGELLAFVLREETAAPSAQTPCTELSGKKFSIVSRQPQAGGATHYSAQGDYYIETMQVEETNRWQVVYRFDFSATRYDGTPVTLEK